MEADYNNICSSQKRAFDVCCSWRQQRGERERKRISGRTAVTLHTHKKEILILGSLIHASTRTAN